MTIKPIPTEILESLRRASDIVAVTHENPDGDAIGSLLGMTLGLRKLGKRVTALADRLPLPNNLAFLHGVETLQAIDAPIDASGAVLVSVDSATLERTLTPGSILEQVNLVINLDHHASNPHFGNLNYVEPNLAATGQIILHLLQGLGVELDQEICDNLYTAIMTDTGNFKHGNTDAQVFRDCCALMDGGARPNEIAQKYYNVLPLASMQIQGRALARTEILAEGKIISTYVTREDFAETGAANADTEGTIEKLQRYEHLTMAVFFREEENGVKISLRGNEPFDVSKLAARFGGGGHPRAAGARLDASISMDEARRQVHDAMFELLTQHTP